MTPQYGETVRVELDDSQLFPAGPVNASTLISFFSHPQTSQHSLFYPSHSRFESAFTFLPVGLLFLCILICFCVLAIGHYQSISFLLLTSTLVVWRLGSSLHLTSIPTLTDPNLNSLLFSSHLFSGLVASLSLPSPCVFLQDSSSQPICSPILSINRTPKKPTESRKKSPAILVLDILVVQIESFTRSISRRLSGSPFVLDTAYLPSSKFGIRLIATDACVSVGCSRETD